MLEDINIYILTLKNSERFKELKSYLDKFELKYNIVYGVNGKLVKRNEEPRISNFCKNICTSGIIGCGLSHIKIWELISDSSSSKLNLIIEDDTFVNFEELEKELPNIEKFIKDKKETGIDIIIQLSGMVFGLKNNKKNISEEYNLVNYKIHLQTGAYIVPKETAIVLQNNIKLNYHIDVMLNTVPITNYIIEPNLSLQMGQENSTMSDKNKKIINKIFKNDWYYALTLPWFKIPYFNIIINLSFVLFIIISIIFIVFKVEPVLFILIGLMLLETISFDT